MVEDDDGMRAAIETLLDAAGIANAAYPSAEALLAEDTVRDALCIISDLKLPAMSGLQLLTELRTRGAQPPVIVITAHDGPGVRQDAERCGAAAYFAKPFPGSALLAAIERVTETAGPK
ncbi:MAG: response regulator [Betaproteobacteria bacterium]